MRIPHTIWTISYGPYDLKHIEDSKFHIFEHFPLWSIGWPRDFLKMSIAVSGSNPCCSIKKRDTKYPVRFTPCEQWTPMAEKTYYA